MYAPRRFHMAEEKDEVLETQSADGEERRPYQMRKGF